MYNQGQGHNVSYVLMYLYSTHSNCVQVYSFQVWHTKNKSSHTVDGRIKSYLHISIMVRPAEFYISSKNIVAKFWKGAVYTGLIWFHAGQIRLCLRQLHIVDRQFFAFCWKQKLIEEG